MIVASLISFPALHVELSRILVDIKNQNVPESPAIAKKIEIKLFYFIFLIRNETISKPPIHLKLWLNFEPKNIGSPVNKYFRENWRKPKIYWFWKMISSNCKIFITQNELIEFKLCGKFHLLNVHTQLSLPLFYANTHNTLETTKFQTNKSWYRYFFNLLEKSLRLNICLFYGIFRVSVAKKKI